MIKTKRDASNTVPTEECTPPDHVFPSEEQPLSIEALFPKSVIPKVRNIVAHAEREWHMRVAQSGRLDLRFMWVELSQLISPVLREYTPVFLSPQNNTLQAAFHSVISPPPAKNFDMEIIFLRSCVAEDTCSAGPVVENFHLLFDLTLTARKNS